jgi:hypothetical protein
MLRSRQKHMLIFGLLAAAVLLTTAPLASASGVTCRVGNGCLNGDDFYDWTANYGPPFSNIPNNSTATSFFGFEATVNFAGGGDGQRRDQGNGWGGNFTPGDELLWTNSPGQGPLTITFDQIVMGVGANIQADFFGDFTALIQAFDVNGNLIDSFSENGTSNGNGDGSAIFIGLTNEPGIKSVEFSITSCALDCADFAINQLDTLTGNEGVPEPATLVLMGSALFSLGGIARKRLGKRF